MKSIGTAFFAALLVVGCGGGDSASEAAGTPASTSQPYITQAGLQWSAPSESLHPYPSFVASLNTLETTAISYCTRQTCDAGGSNCRPTNFNQQLGWRLPTLDEMKALHASGAMPADWKRSETWSNSQGLAFNFKDGNVFITVSDSIKYRVTCVKPA